jgi:hypothetical protein
MHCGALDTLHHRLFTCPCTQALRAEHFRHQELEWLESNPCRAVLMQGLQLLPPAVASRPSGLGHQPSRSWTLSGQPLEEVMQGTVFTDGSFTPLGPPTWSVATWAVVKTSQDGVLLAWASGSVGKDLPNTIAAAERVGVLAAGTISQSVKEARSDCLAVSGLQDKPMHVVSHRSSMYSGVHRQILGRSADEFKVSKVQAHMDIDAAPTDEARYDAIGNDFADRVAKAESASLPRPSDLELQEWSRQQAFLQAYFKFLPQALMHWPAIGPSQGHKSLPKRADSELGTRRSFRDDLLGPWSGDAGGLVEPTPPPEVVSEAEPPPTSSSSKKEPLKHVWKWTAGKWICTSCLTTSRTAVPRQIFGCLGLAPNIRHLLQHPQGHKLQIATFTSGAGIVVICSGCGRFTTSNRRGVLHKERCPSVDQAAFQSDGAKNSYRRVCEGKHPSYKEGNSKVLDPCFAAAALLEAAEGSSSSKG